MLFSKFRAFLLTLLLLSIGFMSEAQTISFAANTPASNSTNFDGIGIRYNISESPVSGSVKVALTCTAGPCLTASAPSFVLNMTGNAITRTFTVTSDLTAGSGTFTTTATTLMDGTYSMTASFRRVSSGVTVTSSPLTNVTFDATTIAPQLNSPISNSASTTPMAIRLTLGEPALTNSVNLTFTNVAGTYTNTLNVASSAVTQTFSLDTRALVDGTNIASATYSTTLPDDTYNVTLSYRDGFGHPAAVATSSNVVIQTVTPAFTVLGPLNGAVFSSTNSPTFTYFFPVASSSATLTLSPGYTYAIPAGVASGTYSFTITNNPPPDGTYTATITYSDIILNPPATSSPISIIFDRATISPSLYSPAANSPYSTVIPVNLTLGEAFQPGSSKLVFTNTAGTFSNTLTLANGTLSQTFTLLASALASSSNVAFSTFPTLPDDTYNVTLTYRDENGNPETSVTSTNVLLQSRTPRPSITNPASGFVFSSATSPTLTYNLPSAPLSGTVVLTLSPGYSYTLPNQAGSGTYTITSNIPADGTYTATISYQDFLGNPLATSVPLTIKFQRNTPSPSISSPTNNTYFSSYMLFKGSLPTSNFAGSKKLSFVRNNTVVSTIFLNNSRTDSLYFNLNRLSESGSAVASIVGLDSLTDGVYTLTLSYQDSYGNPAAASNSVTITKDSSPLIGVLSHTDNVVFGVFTETLTFNKPVVEIAPNPIIPNLINNSMSATLGQLTPNSTRTVFTFQVTPLQQGMIKLQAPFMGVAMDIAGNNSQVIGIDSIQYVDTTIILKPVIVGIATFCQRDSITLTSSVANSYLWSTGATSRSIVVKQAGTYNVKTAYANRVKGLSDNAIIVVKPTPATPTLTRDLANNLVSSNANGNKWYKDGVSISDTTKLIKPVSGSTYTAKTELNGCSSPLSSPFVYLITEIVRLNSVEFIKLAPNPFVNQLTIDFSVGGYQQLNIEVVEISTGISVFSKQGLVAGSAIDLGQLSSGTYIVRVSSADAKLAEQFKVIKL